MNLKPQLNEFDTAEATPSDGTFQSMNVDAQSLSSFPMPDDTPPSLPPCSNKNDGSENGVSKKLADMELATKDLTLSASCDSQETLQPSKTTTGCRRMERIVRRDVLKEECQKLRDTIQATRSQREGVYGAMEIVQQKQIMWMHRRNRIEAERDMALENYTSFLNQRATLELYLQGLQTMNATNDSFHIWHRGPFGTINELRLGSEAPRLPPSSSSSETTRASSNVTSGEFDFVSLFVGTLFDTSNNARKTTTGGGYDSCKVSWPESNAALGMVALLLSTLEQKENSGIRFITHEIVPMGSTSKIGVRQPDGRPPTFYNLYYSDESFQFFAKKNFNVALNGLLQCLADAVDAARLFDPTISPPHHIHIGSSRGGDSTIGGLPISYGNTNTNSNHDGENWTRAMKYYLTNLKWLVAIMTKYVDL